MKTPQVAARSGNLQDPRVAEAQVWLGISSQEKDGFQAGLQNHTLNWCLPKLSTSISAFQCQWDRYILHILVWSILPDTCRGFRRTWDAKRWRWSKMQETQMDNNDNNAQKCPKKGTPWKFFYISYSLIFLSFVRLHCPRLSPRGPSLLCGPVSCRIRAPGPSEYCSSLFITSARIFSQVYHPASHAVTNEFILSGKQWHTLAADILRGNDFRGRHDFSSSLGTLQ